MASYSNMHGVVMNWTESLNTSSSPPPAGYLGVRTQCYKNGSWYGESSLVYSSYSAPGLTYATALGNYCGSPMSGGYYTRGEHWRLSDGYWQWSNTATPGHNF
ncbi:MAG: hypothetical protein R3B97_02480 [Dehalococcoidia bacterium]|nr:hypothetical protein [Dehalococcoidia bacterium]MCB9485193.1 hypothetical protein [Thermoflexaceae bacterium]